MAALLQDGLLAHVVDGHPQLGGLALPGQRILHDALCAVGPYRRVDGEAFHFADASRAGLPKVGRILRLVTQHALVHLKRGLLVPQVRLQLALGVPQARHVGVDTLLAVQQLRQVVTKHAVHVDQLRLHIVLHVLRFGAPLAYLHSFVVDVNLLLRLADVGCDATSGDCPQRTQLVIHAAECLPQQVHQLFGLMHLGEQCLIDGRQVGLVLCV
mmetsp:Transcript_36732/g.65758  ORF Transcript_36732/g.65758 Transcript_36732/m.65758 type:complete len:213 (-) Transcript_36732:415-1053(-)